MSNLIKEAITGYWGERCPDHIEGCPVCAAWKEYDNMHEEYFKKLNTLIERLVKIKEGKAYDRYENK